MQILNAVGSRAKKLWNYARSDKKLWAQFARYDWVTQFEIDGVHYGGWYPAPLDPRVRMFQAAFPECKTVLEIGSMEGGHTIALSRLRSIKRVIALEGRESNIKKAEFVIQLFGSQGVEFHCVDLEDESLVQFQSCDAVFCVGFLYHLRKPWAFLRKLRRVSPNVFLWTHTAPQTGHRTAAEGYEGWIYSEGDSSHTLSGLSPDSFWPTIEALQRMLVDAGFSRNHLLEVNPDHAHGPTVTMIARE